MSLEEIECSDRCFANQCESGDSIYKINELFSTLRDMKSSFSYEKAAKVYAMIDSAKFSWDYIKYGLSEINDDTRCSKSLNDFKLRVTKATDSNDII